MNVKNIQTVSGGFVGSQNSKQVFSTDGKSWTAISLDTYYARLGVSRRRARTVSVMRTRLTGILPSGAVL